MATRKRRSPAQRRAFARMISRNPYHKRRSRRNPAPLLAANPRRRRVYRRRTVHHYRPARYAHRRRRRNPSNSDFIGSDPLDQGMMGIAAVVGTPTLMQLRHSTNLFPNTTGIYDAAAQAAVGVAAAYVVSKFLDKQTGQIVAMVAIGTGVASGDRRHPGRNAQRHERVRHARSGGSALQPSAPGPTRRACSP